MLVCWIHGPRDIRLETAPEPTPGPGEVLVKLGAAGICGGDLHYYQHGRAGAFVVREPLIPGHEASGTVVAVGKGVGHVKAGDRVAVSPSHACGKCEVCRAGRENLCTAMCFLGSASVFPHSKGFFRDYFVIGERQCFPVRTNVPLADLAFAEPLAVALHAVSRAGGVLGANVLITGSGPIGCVIAMAARLGGAVSVSCTDVLDGPLGAARAVGADEIIRADLAPERLAERRFDVAFEASGSVAALRNCVAGIKRGGVVMQVGTVPSEPVPILLNEIGIHEVDLRGTFRWGREFGWAVRYLEGGRVHVAPLLSGQFALRDAVAAFEAALDRSRNMKVQLIGA
jgi:L-idonate 5-dehydrogenase